MARNISDVIDRVLGVLPDEGYADLRAKLDKVKSDAGFRAPELASIDWKHASDALAETFGNAPASDSVADKVQAVWLGREA
jgi:hypothetical protein